MTEDYEETSGKAEAELIKILTERIISDMVMKIESDEVYRKYILSSPHLQPQTVRWLEAGIQFYEKSEQYEKCAILNSFKREIHNQILVTV